MINYKEYVENKLAEEIRETMSSLNFPEFYGHIRDDDIHEFEIVKRTSSLITELLSNKETKQIFIEKSNESTVNGENNDVKIEFFEAIRNILIHFPFFKSWNEVFICKEMLKWNREKDGEIIKFFNKNKNKNIKYTIFTKQDGQWKEKHIVNVYIPELPDSERLYIKDVICLEDVIWTFCIIDYYFDYMGYKLDKYTGASI